MTPPRGSSPGPTHNDLLVTLIQGIREAIQQTADRQTAHERYCLEREDKATAVRHDFRAEVAMGQAAVAAKIERMEAKLAEKVDRVDGKLDAAKEALHARITDHRTRWFNWTLGVAGVLILILLGILGWALPEALQAAAPMPLTTVPFGVAPAAPPG